MDAALGQIEWDRVQLEQSETDARDREAEASELATRRETLARDVEQLPEARANLSEIRLKFGDLESQMNAAKVRLGVVREAVERSERMAREAAELGKKRDELIRERWTLRRSVHRFRAERHPGVDHRGRSAADRE